MLWIRDRTGALDPSTAESDGKSSLFPVNNKNIVKSKVEGFKGGTQTIINIAFGMTMIKTKKVSGAPEG